MTAPDFASVFAEAHVDAAFHAVDLGNGNEVGHQADSYAIPASVFKLPVLVELFRQHAAGEIDAVTPVLVPVENRAAGPNGLSIMLDPMRMSLRDLAWQMMGISDNAATDVICAYVGLDKVNANLDRLGIKETQIGRDCRGLFAEVAADLGVDSLASFTEELTWETYATLSSLDPERATSRTTPRDMTTLLRLIWDDEAAPASACADVRRILGLQVWPHRLASGWGDMDKVKTSGKTGTLPAIRNEAGVVEYPDGGRYAVATFTRADSLRAKNPEADAVIGRAARLAVDHLRSIA